jgi:membrane associated rhomboid family serine protease
LARQKRATRRKSFWAIGLGTVLTVFSFAATWALIHYFPESLEDAGLEDKSFVAILFRNIVFLLGLFFLAGGVWGIVHAKNLKIEDYIATPEAVEFIEAARETKPYYSYLLVGAIAAVFLVQYLTGSQNLRGRNDWISYSVDLAGLVKPLVRQGEWWRILTAAALHGGFLHIYFNGQAFYGLGSTIEYLSNRAHLAIVFLLAVIGGSLTSLIFMPTGNSVGASGGIMGLIGYLAVYGYRRQQHLPPGFLKSMLINIGFIAAFGVVGYQFIDNFAHLGGLLTGAVYGFVQVPHDLLKNPRETNAPTQALGVVSVVIFLGVCLFSILRLLKVF